MSMISKITATVTAMFIATSLTLAHAQDAALEQAKAQGVVGEMYTGYLGVVDGANASSDVRRRIDEVNAKRLEAYTDLASKSGQTVAVVAALTAEKLIARADGGEVVKPGAGDAWTKK